MKRLISIICAFLLLTISANTMAMGNSKYPHTKSQKEFIDFILPKVDAVNKDIHTERVRLLALENKHKNKKNLTSDEKVWLKSLAKKYNVSSKNLDSNSMWLQLKQKVDIIPPSLAIAQAATESAWGKSRFAKQGNNYFGHSCYKPGCGIVPKRRPKGKHYEVKKYSSATDSIRNYMNNLNSHNAYSNLRSIRYEQRKQNNNPQGMMLAKGLSRYAETGQVYVRSISKVIRKYHLDKFDSRTIPA